MSHLFISSINIYIFILKFQFLFSIIYKIYRLWLLPNTLGCQKHVRTNFSCTLYHLSNFILIFPQYYILIIMHNLF